MGDEPFWLTHADILAIHDEQLRRFGGLEGIKDDNLLHSALASPRHLRLYDRVDDILSLAIRLCIALAKNHGFVDGNKRTAAAGMIEFLAINGYDLLVPDDEADTPLLGQWVERAVIGRLSERQLYDRLDAFLQDRR